MNLEILQMIGITGAKVVEIEVSSDNKVVWVNIDGLCRLRACRIKTLLIKGVRQTWKTKMNVRMSGQGMANTTNTRNARLEKKSDAKCLP